ncbi:helix-turn-helix domain-containing protein [Bacillus infantis]|uniref:helix-turn-helix domain-containing protein n=1 Tax=Bacillus infantis TaxID=324767 RepID=UPI002004800F|nr:helix-turn-helix domain-containing protein [Bacillus infantis]MCK6203974.1 helix-turn-helix domain-containing protein [Bacillus infantis]
MNQLPEVLKAADISRFLQVSPRYAYEIMERKDFPLLRVGRAKRVMKDDFLKWIEAQKAS